MHHLETAPGGGVRLRGLDRAALGPLAASFRRRGMCVAGLSDGGLQLTESGSESSAFFQSCQWKSFDQRRRSSAPSTA